MSVLGLRTQWLAGCRSLLNPLIQVWTEGLAARNCRSLTRSLLLPLVGVQQGQGGRVSCGAQLQRPQRSVKS